MSSRAVARPAKCGQTGGAPTATIDKIKVDGDDAKVKFSADEPDVDFECKLDQAKYKRCDPPKKYRNLAMASTW